jgi:hypothetical protein
MSISVNDITVQFLFWFVFEHIISFSLRDMSQKRNFIMSTNYFCVEKDTGKKHIGKLSCGWAFVFHGYDEDGFKISNYEEWEKYLLRRSVKIYDEEDNKLNVKDFLKLVKDSLSTKRKKQTIQKDKKSWHDKEGFAFFNYYFC